MAKSKTRRIAVVASSSAAAVAVAAVVAVNGVGSASHDAAASVSASEFLSPPESDVLSDASAKARDRALRQSDGTDRPATPAATPTPSPAADPLEALNLPEFTGRDIDCAEIKCVALTFDDGPGSQTDTLLRSLKSANAVATWFPLGEVIADNPDNLREIADAGMEIGNHSWSHPELTRLNDSAVSSQINRTSAEVDRVIGQRPTLVRPPYGSVSRRVTRDLGRLGSPAILWDVDPLDWKYRNSDSVYRRVMGQVRAGSIVLMHDVHPTTVAAVPRILKALHDRGYTFVTVSELFGGKLVPGKTYTSNHDAYRPDAARKD